MISSFISEIKQAVVISVLILIFNFFFRNYEIGHFAQIVMEGAYRVGCAQTKYISKLNGGDESTTLTVCNYASTPTLDYLIYTAGESASACKSGRNSEHPGLCSESEKYDTT